jgi:hypothetical protein
MDNLGGVYALELYFALEDKPAGPVLRVGAVRGYTARAKKFTFFVIAETCSSTCAVRNIQVIYIYIYIYFLIRHMSKNICLIHTPYVQEYLSYMIATKHLPTQFFVRDMIG